MRIAFTVIFALLIGALGYCAASAGRSHKAIGRAVSTLLLALIPPMIGNLILILSSGKALSTAGCYIYFLGMDLVMYALLRFTAAYCSITWPRTVQGLVYFLLGVDVLQFACNPFFGNAFDTEAITFSGAPYYRLVPYPGQTYHRVVDYGILFAVILIFFVKMLRSPRINSERYSVILVTMLITTVWESFYIFSRTPVDRSMVGFGVFGLLVYYFSLYYRPLRLLDRLLAAIASEMSEALFFFDAGGRCIWANRPGIALTGIEDENFETANGRLTELFGSWEETGEDQSSLHTSGTGEDMKSYVLEKHTVSDEKGRAVGAFLSVRDNSDEQKTLQREIYNATHDSLTDLYNRSGYNLLLSRLELSSTLMLLVDVDRFKSINDTYGHEVGDRILKKVARTVVQSFRSDDYVCRIGGDEIVVLVSHTPEIPEKRISDRVGRINRELSNTGDGLPAVSVSVGVAHGDRLKDPVELFERADRALYETKRNGRRGYTIYSAQLGA